MIDRRLIVTLLLAAALLLLGGWGRPREEKSNVGLEQGLFWRTKVELAPAYDLILTGDSRTYMGVDPATMATVLRGERIFNYGFQQLGYSAFYLNHAAAGLDPASPKKCVVLGITPLSLTRYAVSANGFKVLMRDRDGAVVRWARPVLDRLLPIKRFLRPIRPKDLVFTLIGRAPLSYSTQTFHANGWDACTEIPPDDIRKLGVFSALFEGNTISPKVIELVLDYTRRWSGAGIEVYGYRPPTTAAMVALETGKGGFDEADFVARFEAAGGHWLAIEPFGRYSTFDGSHLDESGARALSADLAAAIRDARQARRPPGD